MFKKSRLKILLLPTFGLSVLALIFSLSSGARLATVSAGSTFTLYLPIVGHNFPVQTVFGAELGQLTTAGGLDQLAATKAGWVRRNAVLWSDVQPTPGTWYWSALAGLESELADASSRGLQTILIVRGTPAWAQKVPGANCGPIAQASLGAFGSFMHDLVARYSVPPYNVKYWEIWNEPDLDPSLVPGDSIYGCWGDHSDPYYGGRYYATMLQTIYPRVKAADPQAQVLVGGLLIDCDPRGPCTAGRWDPLRAKFLEGILVGGGAPNFDGVSFHAYDVYWGKLGQYGLSHWGSAWNTTGPVVTAKTSFVKSVLASYGVTSKILMNTESGLLLCDSCGDDATFETSKAYYVAQLYAASIAQGLKADIWYSMYGWQNSGLLGPGGTPLPAYNAFKFASSELQGIQFSRELSYAGLKGYELDRGDARIWVLWSLDGNPHTITLPGIPYTAFHADGTPFNVGTSLTVTLEPVYLEWRGN